MYAVTYDVPVGIVRCANLFGGGDLNFNRVIPGVVRAAILGEPFEIRSDGKFVRDFLYAEDATDAYLTVAEHLEGNPALNGEAFNFSLELRLTVLEIVEMVKHLAGNPSFEVIVRNIASNEVREQYSSSDKARRMLGWAPRHGLEEGLRRTLRWYREHFATRTQTADAVV